MYDKLLITLQQQRVVYFQGVNCKGKKKQSVGELM